MSRNQALQDVSTRNLHISHNQIFTYSQLFAQIPLPVCRKSDRLSGSASPYLLVLRSIQPSRCITAAHEKPWQLESLEALCERFQTCLESGPGHTDVPVIFKKDLPDHKGAMEMGNVHAQGVSRNHRPNCPDYQEIVAVELPLCSHALHG